MVSARTARRLRFTLLLGLTAAAAYAALLSTALLSLRRFEDCPAYEDEGLSAAPASDQGWWCGDDRADWTPETVAAVAALAVALVVLVVLWRRAGLRGWLAGLVVLLVTPLLAHLALQLPDDECSAAQLRAEGRGRCATDRELMRE